MKRFIFILSTLLLSVASYAQNGALSNDFFYFDNPDGTIVSYPEYIDDRLENRAMSISSTKYKREFNGTYDGPYKDVFDLMLGQHTRTYVFVFSGGQKAAKPAMTVTMTYAAALQGLFAGLWDQMNEKLSKGGSSIVVMGNYKDGLSISKPEECTFMGCEAIHWISKVDMSKSPFMVAVGAPIQFIFEQYCYYEPKLDKTVGVIFQYTEADLNAPVSTDIKAYATLMDILRSTLGWGPGKNTNANIELFKRRDMIDFFKQHFHLKSAAETKDKECDDPPELYYPKNSKVVQLIQCGDTIEITEQVTKPGKEKRKYKGGELVEGPGDGSGDPEPGPGPGPDPRKPTPPPIIDPKPKPEPKPKDDSQKEGRVDGARAEFAVVKFPQSILRPTAENNKYMFFLENHWSPTNAVVAVDKYSGKITDFVSTKQKEERGTIQYIGAHGDDLYLGVEGKGIVLYDGKSVATSKVVAAGECEENGEKATIIFSPNGRYMAVVGTECSVYDVQNAYKRVKHISDDDIIGAVLTDDGDLLRLIGSTLYIARNDGNERSQQDIDLYNLFNTHPVGISLVGDNMYIMGGGVVAVSNVKQLDWHRGARLPENVRFNICGYLSPAGRGVAGVLGGGDGRMTFFSSNPKEDVKTLRTLETTVKDQYGGKFNVTYLYGCYVDRFGNYWLKTDERTFIIYGPGGISNYGTLNGLRTYTR